MWPLSSTLNNFTRNALSRPSRRYNPTARISISGGSKYLCYVGGRAAKLLLELMSSELGTPLLVPVVELCIHPNLSCGSSR